MIHSLLVIFLPSLLLHIKVFYFVHLFGALFIRLMLHKAKKTLKIYSSWILFFLTVSIIKIFEEDSRLCWVGMLNIPQVLLLLFTRCDDDCSQGALMTCLANLKENKISLSQAGNMFVASLLSDNVFTGNTVAKKGNHSPNSHGTSVGNQNET